MSDQPNLIERFLKAFKNTAVKGRGPDEENTRIKLDRFESREEALNIYNQEKRKLRIEQQKLDDSIEQYERSVSALFAMIDSIPDQSRRLEILNGFFYQQLLVIRQTANEAMEC